MKASFLLASALLLASCQLVTVSPPPQQATPEPTRPGATAVVTSPLGSPLQRPTTTSSPGVNPTAPKEPTRLPNVIPTPATGKAVVVGILNNTKAGGTFASVKVFLAKIYYSADGTQAAFGLDIRTSPRAITAADGYFAFVDVEPGDYLLMVGDPTFAGTVKYADSAGNDIVLKLVAGQTRDLGVAKVSY